MRFTAIDRARRSSSGDDFSSEEPSWNDDYSSVGLLPLEAVSSPQGAASCCGVGCVGRYSSDYRVAARVAATYLKAFGWMRNPPLSSRNASTALREADRNSSSLIVRSMPWKGPAATMARQNVSNQLASATPVQMASVPGRSPIHHGTSGGGSKRRAVGRCGSGQVDG
jgi:hypothetical protein